ncbi:MAG TPA: M14 family zinc carboxypeptidase, partial [Planctomycetota bacterium]|nr:M14 family zinc carboxypeptidase [Planctomycetota bacterium]
MKFPLIAPLAVFLFLFGPLPGQTPPAAAAPDPTAGVSYDPEIPTLASLLGHEVGAEISTHADVARAIDGLAKASRRVRVFTYGSSWEKRSLVCAVVGTEARLAELDTIREGMGQLANPRDLQTEVAETLVSKLPAVAWLANCVHGDEPSGTDAALMLLYHLLAAQNDPTVERILDECLVIIDPIQNPDGRDRFCHSTRAARGRFPDAHA